MKGKTLSRKLRYIRSKNRNVRSSGRYWITAQDAKWDETFILQPRSWFNWKAPQFRRVIISEA